MIDTCYMIDRQQACPSGMLLCGSMDGCMHVGFIISLLHHVIRVKSCHMGAQSVRSPCIILCGNNRLCYCAYCSITALHDVRDAMIV